MGRRTTNGGRGVQGRTLQEIDMFETKHGLSRHPVYFVWRSMKSRCLNPKSQAWANYGGRGITVCEEWSNSFEVFWNDMKDSYRAGLTLERLDVNKGYSKENCTWVDRRTQAQNRRNATLVKTPKGLMNVSEAARQFGLNANTLLYRLKRNWPQEKLFIVADVTNRV